MGLLQWITNSEFSAWVRESDSLFAYPMFITLHTFGLAFVVGLSALVNVMVLKGVPQDTLKATRRLFVYAWIGFGLTFVSGLVLTLADATTMLLNPVMWVKFGFIVVGLVGLWQVERVVFIGAPGPGGQVAPRGRMFALLTLACWVGAIVAGRLTAYLGPVAGLLAVG